MNAKSSTRVTAKELEAVPAGRKTPSAKRKPSRSAAFTRNSFFDVATSLINVPSGCVFNPRCGFTDQVADRACFKVHPELVDDLVGHSVRCHIEASERRRIWRNDISIKLS